MSSFGEQSRLPGEKTRDRRNADKWKNTGAIADPAGVITVNATGQLTVTLAANGGLEAVSSALQIKLNGADLALAAAGISISDGFRDEVRAVAAKAADDASGESNQLVMAGLAASEALKVSLFND